MKKYIKNIIVILIILFSFNFVNASYVVNPKIKKIVSHFFTKIEKKYDYKQEKQYLEKINSRINFILENKKLNYKNQKLLKDILVLFNEKIFNLDYKISLENKNQKFIEAKIIYNLKEKINKIQIPYYLKNIWKKIYRISEKQEFVENNQIKKIDFSRYYSVKPSNINQFKNKNWIFAVDINNKIYFIENYKFLTKIKYSESTQYFKNFINYKTKFFKQWNNFYSYNFKNYRYFQDNYGFYKKTLKENNIDENNTILYFSEKNKYNFIINYQKVKLINSDIIYWIVDKKNFLDDLVNDKLYLTNDTDELFKKLKQETEKLTKNKKTEEKIKIIYDYLLKNIDYTKNFSLNDKRIFSGILTYKNKNWVCEWYVKLFSYMLKFAGISNVRIIRWDVIDAKDFPKIGHAWVKIWDKYYDPTFDDPIGQTHTKSFKEYKYFWLPKDLFYTNRFDYGTTPEYLKSKSLNFRINLVNKNLSKLVNKYKNKNYLLLKWAEFKKENNINFDENTKIEDLKKIINFYQVEEVSKSKLLIEDKNWKKWYIKSLRFYQINNNNLGDLLKQLNYNLDWYSLLEWKKNWKIEYRLAFELKIIWR